MITTGENVTIQKVIRAGIVTSYTIDKVSLFIKHNGEQKRFNATSIINATTTESGLVEFTSVPLWGDGSYSLYVTAESNVDLDISGVSMVKLGSGYIKKIPVDNTLII